jgi:general stress protein CsbA
MPRMTENSLTTSAPVNKSKVPAWLDRLTPRTGVRVQLFSAAIVWLVGASILLIRGVQFLHDRWIIPIIVVALVIGFTKERYILSNYARKAVARIHKRGKACYFGFFSVKSWLFILIMMGGGIALRRSVLADSRDIIPWGRDVLAVIYVAVGTALAYADRIYWKAALAKTPAELDAVEHEED